MKLIKQSIVRRNSRGLRQFNFRRMRTSRQSRLLGVELLEDRRLLSAGNYFAWTDYGGTWFDVQKQPDSVDCTPEPGKTGSCNDNNMCWAAAAANALAWTGWGFHNFDSPNEMFERFQVYWSDSGATAKEAWEWWINNRVLAPEKLDFPVGAEPTGAGFFHLEEEDVRIREELNSRFVMSQVDQWLHDGYGVAATLTEVLLGNQTRSHAVAVWGYSYDDSISKLDTGYYTKLWITDSDDSAGLSSIDLSYDVAESAYRVSPTAYLHQAYALPPGHGKQTSTTQAAVRDTQWGHAYVSDYHTAHKVLPSDFGSVGIAAEDATIVGYTVFDDPDYGSATASAHSHADSVMDVEIQEPNRTTLVVEGALTATADALLAVEPGEHGSTYGAVASESDGWSNLEYVFTVGPFRADYVLDIGDQTGLGGVSIERVLPQPTASFPTGAGRLESGVYILRAYTAAHVASYAEPEAASTELDFEFNLTFGNDFSVSSAAPRSDGGLSYHLDVEGPGARVDIGLYLSADETWDPNDDLFVRKNPEWISQAETRFFSGPLTQPDQDRPYWVIVADPTREHGESDETNNVTAIRGNFTEAARFPESIDAELAHLETDDDDNGLFDELVVNIPVEVDPFSASGFEVSGDLFDQFGEFIASEHVLVPLSEGSNQVSLSFDGRDIWRHRADGPLTLRNLELSHNGYLINASEAVYETAAYAYTLFERPNVVFTGSYSESLKDLDADGVPDLAIGAEIVVVDDLYVQMGARLLDLYGQEIDTAEAYVDVVAGEPRIIELCFDALTIFNHGVDGPYTVVDLAVSDETGGEGDRDDYDMAEPHVTQSYTVDDFNPSLISLTGNYSEYLTDIDQDGLAEYFTFTAKVSTRSAGETVVYVALVDTTGEWITDAWSVEYLEAGQTHTFELNFDGGIINSHGMDGPFYIVDLDVAQYTLDGDFVASDDEDEPYTTAAYGAAEFETYEQRIVVTDYFDFLKDVNADGIPDYMTIGANVTGVYSGEAGAWFDLLGPEGWGFAWGDTFMNLQAGEPQTIEVDVPIGPILANGTDGPFVVAAGFFYVNGSEYYVPDAHLTHPYRLSDLDGSGVNHAPVLAPIGNKSTNEEELIGFTVLASDPNDEPTNNLTLSAMGLPTGAVFDSLTGQFSWIPTESQQGTYDITFTVTDDGTPNLSADETITITVLELNDAPMLGPIGNKSTNEEEVLSFTALASDPDDAPANNLTLSAAGLPTGAAFDPLSGQFSWTPTESQQGTYDITFTVTDDGTPNLSADETMTITVLEVNATPTANPGGPFTVDGGSSIVLDGSGSFDPDETSASLTYEWDFDYDDIDFNVDTTGISPTFDASELDGPLDFTVALRVTDTPGAWHIATTTLSVEDSQPAGFTLEPPAADAAGSVFLQSSGPISVPGETADLTFPITSAEFTIAGGVTRLGFELTSPDGSVDPAPVVVRNAGGNPVAPYYTTMDVADSDSSLALVQLGFGSYTVSMGAENTATGNVTLNVILLGDLDGDHQVTRSENSAIRRLLGASAGDTRYQREADSDLDGDIDTFDYLECRRNVSDAVNMFPPLMMAASAAIDQSKSDAELAAYQLAPMISTTADESAAIGLVSLSHHLTRGNLQRDVYRALERGAATAGHRPPLSGGEYARTVDEVFATRLAHEKRAAADRFTPEDAEMLDQMATWRNIDIARRAARMPIQALLPGNSPGGDAEEPEPNVFEDLLGLLARDKARARLSS